MEAMVIVVSWAIAVVTAVEREAGFACDTGGRGSSYPPIVLWAGDVVRGR